MRHTLSVLVENKPGALMRISSMFARRGFNIDVIDTDARAPDNAQARSSLQYRRCHFGLTAHHDGAELWNERHQLRLAQAGAHGHLQRIVGRKLIDTALGNGISD